MAALAEEVLKRCDDVAQYTEEPGKITRTFLCEPMHALHERLGDWMRAAGMEVRLDAIGNLIGRYPSTDPSARVFVMGSHLDSVPDAGKYDGVLGVLLSVAAVQALDGRRLPFPIDVVGFCEEEGIRYRASYLGSRAVCGCFPAWLLRETDANGVSLADAMRQFGLDPKVIPQAAYSPAQVLAYLEPHIEQGPVLAELEAPLGVVETIIGQSRLWLRFAGKAGHAGTQPMANRRDALAAASEFVLAVEHYAHLTDGLRATVGSLAVSPGAVNVVPGAVDLSLDVRHARDHVRERAVKHLGKRAAAIAAWRRMRCSILEQQDHEAVPTDAYFTGLLSAAIEEAGLPAHRLSSGAGHDAAIMAGIAPVAMLFVRSPNGISHSPRERVEPDDVRAALDVLVRFLDRVAEGEARGGREEQPDANAAS